MEFEHSEKVRALQARVEAFMVEHIYPNEEELFAEVNEGDRWQPVWLLENLKAEARTAGLWNLFLPESDYGGGLTNLEYAPLCEIMGRSPWAPEHSSQCRRQVGQDVRMQVGCDNGVERLRFHHYPHGHRIDQHLVPRHVRELRRYLDSDLVPHHHGMALRVALGDDRQELARPRLGQLEGVANDALHSS